MLSLNLDFSLDFLGDMDALPLTVYTPETKKLLKKQAGVYIIFNSKNKIIYIGESCDIRSRVFTHLSSAKFRYEIELIAVFYKDMDRYERITLEAMLTKQYAPKHDRSDPSKRKSSRKRKLSEAPLIVQGATRVSKGVFFEIRNLILNSNMKKQAIADKFNLHRNTIGNIAGLKLPMYKEWEAERILSSL